MMRLQKAPHGGEDGSLKTLGWCGATKDRPWQTMGTRTWGREVTRHHNWSAASVDPDYVDRESGSSEVLKGGGGDRDNLQWYLFLLRKYNCKQKRYWNPHLLDRLRVLKKAPSWIPIMEKTLPFHNERLRSESATQSRVQECCERRNWFWYVSGENVGRLRYG